MTSNKIIEEPTILARSRNQAINFRKGRHWAHSEFNPQQEAQKFVAKYKPELWQRKYFIVFGMGGAHHLVEIDKKISHSKVLVIEPDPIIYEYGPELLAGLDNEYAVLNPEGPEELFNSPKWAYFLAQKSPIILHPGCFEISRKVFKRILNREKQKSFRGQHEA